MPLRITVITISALLLAATSSEAQYVGATTATLDCSGGIFTFNRACHADFSGSRMCKSVEMIDTVNPPIVGNPGERAWVLATFQPRGGALLLADRVGDALRGRAARLSTGGHAANRLEPGTVTLARELKSSES